MLASPLIECSIATTLLDTMLYTRQAIAHLYGLRWEIETNFRHLKKTMKMEHLKCQTPEGVIKELMIFMLVYNLIRSAMSLAGQCQGVKTNRISFIDAVRWPAALLHAARRKELMELIVNPVATDDGTRV